MSRCVDISELEIPNDECSYEELEAFVEAICESEYIDIVRCKECVFGTYEPEAEMCRCRNHSFPTWTKADDFCSYGEREGE